MRKIAIITGSRAEYGYTRPIIRLIEKDKDLEHQLIVTNMHLLHEFGYSVAEIEGDGIKIAEKIYNTFDGYNYQTMVKSLGVFLMQLPETLKRLQPDLILIAGDRGEQLMAAIAGAHMYIPVAHIQAGEVSGNIDNATRHAIARYTHIHFAASEQAVKRLIASGEEKFRIYRTGAPMLDELINLTEVTPKEEIYSKFNLDKNKQIFLVVIHPVTEEFSSAAENTEKILRAVNSFDNQTIIIAPNSDAGSLAVNEAINRNQKSSIRLFRNLSRRDYAGIMRVSSVMIGNSSSGLIESPVFGLPAINIGRRQIGRESAENVIHVPKYDGEEIIKAIQIAITEEFRKKAKEVKNYYGDGRSSEKILEILKNIKINDELLVKKITY